MASAHIDIFRARDGWRFRIRAANGEIVAQSQRYTRRSSAIRTARRFRLPLTVHDAR